MSIEKGQDLPSVTLKKKGEDGIDDVDFRDYVAGRKVVIFGTPGAYTPPCSEKHLPGFMDHANDFKSKGVDEIICVSVNDPFVMAQWGKDKGADGKLTMMPDGNANFTKAIGLELDGSGLGLGTRSKRYAMIVEDGKVQWMAVEDDAPDVDKASAEAVLAAL